VQLTCNRLSFVGSKESAKDSKDDNIDLQNKKSTEKFSVFLCWLLNLGATFNTAAGAEEARINVSSLKANFVQSLALVAEIMLADRWVCSVARLQRWRTVGEGPQYLKIVGKVLYRLKDIEAYEEACLIRKVL